MQAGDDLWPGFLLGRIPSAAGWQVEARLLDVDDAKVAAGQPAAVYLDSEPARRLHGTIRHVDQVAQEISRDSPRRAFAVHGRRATSSAARGGGRAAAARHGGAGRGGGARPPGGGATARLPAVLARRSGRDPRLQRPGLRSRGG